MKPCAIPILITIGLAACTAREPPAEAAAPAPPPTATPAMPGSDRDAHGCIGSAGYSWCESTGKCERPWELAKEKNFDNSAEAFAGYCRNPAK